MKKSLAFWFSTLMCVPLILGGIAWSHTITITSPTSDTDIRDGDDFAFTTIGDSWDMTHSRDIAFDYHFQQPTVTNGVWTGVYQDSAASVYPVFQLFSSAIYTNYYSYYTPGTPYGPVNPINASKYRKLSMRTSLLQSQRSSLWIYWDTNVYVNANNRHIGFADGDYVWSDYAYYADGYRIYDLGFTTEDFYRERNEMQPVLGTSGSWTGTLYGFTIAPTLTGSEGTSFSIDWIRLYDPSTSPTLTITWDTTVSTNGTNSVQLWLDTDNSGTNGDLFMTGIQNDGQYELMTAALPPGDYYFYLKAISWSRDGYTTLATSEYSPRIRILEAPSFEFTAPSYTSGADYAFTVLGNSWDMSDSSDIYDAKHITGLTFSDGMMYGYADPPEAGESESDSQFYLNTMLNGVYAPIDASAYRYLTVRMAADPTGYTNISDRIARGWVSRAMWGNTSFSADGSISKDIPILEDWHSYTVDLWDNAFLESNPTDTAQTGWLALGTVNFLRFDPLEVPQYTFFWIDDVKLCAENTPANNSYTISWEFSDADSSEVTIALSYGTLSGTTFSGTAIATLSQAPGSGSYTWDTSNVDQGEYYIQAIVSDGSNTVTRCSRVPVVVGDGGGSSRFANGEPVVADYDGDGKSDLAVYSESTGYWTIQFSSNNTISSYQFGAIGWNPVPADYDNDGKADLAVFDSNTGYWFIYSLSGDVIAWAVQWGWPGAVPASGDYDNDGKADLAVFDSNTGYWFIYSLTGNVIAWAVQWGWPGAPPVSGDYDGDGVSDLAVFDSNTGYWFIYSLSGDVIAWAVQWGWPGAPPVSGDYDGDGVSDLALFDSNTGYWFIYSLSGDVIAWAVQWGWPGATAVSGDFDGNGCSDLTIYYSSSGNWFAISLSGGVLIWQ